MVTSLHHVALTVADLNQSIAWYQDIFGFQVIYVYEKNNMQFALLQAGNIKLELFSFPSTIDMEHKSLYDDLRHIGTRHLCIQVDNLDETRKMLKEKNVVIETDVDTAAFGGKYLFVRDCNGILIELYEPEKS